MKILIRSCVTLCILSFAIPASAQLKYGTDFTTSDAIWTVTHVKVDTNMVPDYLEGIRQTWTASNDLAKQMGQIEDYSVYTTELAGSGEYNVMLMVKFANMAQYEKGRKEFKEFEEAWSKKLSEEKRRTIVKTYPNMRTIVGQYMMRQVQFLK
ncbi:MAG: hypothetical protein HQ485_14115 [Acidobacteria bacterium]|jgi:hypothetical protein|nr:hypothetical protein [Acidobacteriota bacterium]